MWFELPETRGTSLVTIATLLLLAAFTGAEHRMVVGLEDQRAITEPINPLLNSAFATNASVPSSNDGPLWTMDLTFLEAVFPELSSPVLAKVQALVNLKHNINAIVAVGHQKTETERAPETQDTPESKRGCPCYGTGPGCCPLSRFHTEASLDVKSKASADHSETQERCHCFGTWPGCCPLSRLTGDTHIETEPRAPLKQLAAKRGCPCYGRGRGCCPLSLLIADNTADASPQKGLTGEEASRGEAIDSLHHEASSVDAPAQGCPCYGRFAPCCPLSDLEAAVERDTKAQNSREGSLHRQALTARKTLAQKRGCPCYGRFAPCCPLPRLAASITEEGPTDAEIKTAEKVLASFGLEAIPDSQE